MVLFDSLPNELLLLIFRRLLPRDRQKISRSCKKFSHLIDSIGYIIQGCHCIRIDFEGQLTFSRKDPSDKRSLFPSELLPVATKCTSVLEIDFLLNLEQLEHISAENLSAPVTASQGILIVQSFLEGNLPKVVDEWDLRLHGHVDEVNEVLNYARPHAHPNPQQVSIDAFPGDMLLPTRKQRDWGSCKIWISPDGIMEFETAT